jgi:hypothetical protein
MKNQTHNVWPEPGQMIEILKQIDKEIEEWVIYFIDQLENIYQ